MQTDQKKYVDVILPVPIMQDFTYETDDHYEGNLVVGMRVVVPFGPKKMYSGIIKKVHFDKPEYETRKILTVLDEDPIITQKQYLLWNWIAEYYLCSEGEVMRASLPSGLKLESHSKIRLNNEFTGDAHLTDLEESYYRFLFDHKSASVTQLNQLSKNKNAYQVIKNLLNKGVITMEESVVDSYRPKMKAMVFLNTELTINEKAQEVFDQMKRAPKQQQLLSFLLDEWFQKEAHSGWEQSDLLKRCNTSAAILNALVEKGWLLKEQVTVSRLQSGSVNALVQKELNAHQQKALDETRQYFSEGKVVLLHGVTASGKTEVYIQLIKEQLKNGKQVLYLVPEIVVATQLIDRLNDVFGSRVGVYHSKFNDAERVEIWNKLLKKDAGDDDNPPYDIIIGARSALLLPFDNLGLIVVDEEHENSYKQFDPAPRYQARDAAIVMGAIHKCNVLLGSATPSFESYYNAYAGKYGYVKIDKRHHQMQMPEIEVSDMVRAGNRKELKAGFGPELYARMEQALENKEQIILFQNRRGYSPLLQCSDCGWIPQCKNCDVSLTYHKYSNTLNCHYCGFIMQMPQQCHSCKSTNVKTKGLGTEKVEDDVKIIFPEARTARLDLDTTRGKHSYQKLISNFTNRKIDILIGTQMVTKGLDFEHVNVIGVLNADMLMNYPDFRSHERAFHLMAQVSGRAGRKNKQGHVVIQTYNPKHPLLDFLKRNDFSGFFKQQVMERQVFKYPPLFRLIYISIKHTDRLRTIAASKQLAKHLRNAYGKSVLGPEFPVVPRKYNRFEMIIRLKMEKNQAIHNHKIHIVRCIDHVRNLENNSGVLFSIDVDPY